MGGGRLPEAADVPKQDEGGGGGDPDLQERRCAMRQDAVALHLSEAEASVPGAALRRLPREDLERPAAAAVYLVVDHVLQALVVRGAQEDRHVQLLAGVAVVHGLKAAHLVPEPVQDLGDLVDADLREGAGITLLAKDGRDLGSAQGWGDRARVSQI